MFFTPKTFAGIHITDDYIELAFLHLVGGSVQFVAAEKCGKGAVQFSGEAQRLFKGALALFSTLPTQKTILKKVALPSVRREKKEQLAETLICSSGLFPKGQLRYAFALGLEGKTNVFCAFKKDLRHHLKTCGDIGFKPHGLSASASALANFALRVCSIQSGSVLHLHEKEGLFLKISEGVIESVHDFSYKKDNPDEIVQAIALVLNGTEKVFVTGPRCFDSTLLQYLKAASGCSFERPDLEKAVAPAKLCHNFALAIGSAIEAAKPPQTQVNFCTGEFEDRRLVWRGLFQESALALHLSVLALAVILIGHLFLEKEAREKTANLKVETNALSYLPKLINSKVLVCALKNADEEIAQMDHEISHIPHAFGLVRAGDYLGRVAREKLLHYTYQFDGSHVHMCTKCEDQPLQTFEKYADH